MKLGLALTAATGVLTAATGSARRRFIAGSVQSANQSSTRTVPPVGQASIDHTTKHSGYEAHQRVSSLTIGQNQNDAEEGQSDSGSILAEEPTSPLDIIDPKEWYNPYLPNTLRHSSDAASAMQRHISPIRQLIISKYDDPHTYDDSRAITYVRYGYNYEIRTVQGNQYTGSQHQEWSCGTQQESFGATIFPEHTVSVQQEGGSQVFSIHPAYLAQKGGVAQERIFLPISTKDNGFVVKVTAADY
jgi:hypothetical protein